MRLIKQNDTTKVIEFLLVSSTDHISPVTGATPSVTISKNGAAFAAASGTVAEIGNGWYKLTPAAGDVDTLGPLLIHATATGADPVDLEFQVVAFDPYSAVSLGLANLDASVSSRSSHSAADVRTEMDTNSTKLANLDATVSSRQPAGAVDLNADQSAVTIGTVNALGTQAKADVNAEVDAALDTAIPATPVAGSVNERLKALDDNYTSARAALLDNLDVTVSSRSSHSAVDVRTEMDANSAKLANLDATVSSRATVSAILAAAVDGAITVQDALKRVHAMAAGKIAKSGSSYTFYAADGTTALYTLTIGTTERTVS